MGKKEQERKERTRAEEGKKGMYSNHGREPETGAGEETISRNKS